MTPRYRLVVLSALVCWLGGCEHATFDNPLEAAPVPDYRIKLSRMPDGSLQAVPPECPDWRTVNNGTLRSEAWPQFGCATARNLAAMVEDPQDLVEGRPQGPANGVVTAYAIKRYLAGKTLPLIDPNAKSPMATQSSVTPDGEKGGGGQGGSTQQH